MLFYDKRDTIDSAGINVLRSGAGQNRGIHERDAEPFQTAVRVFGPCAGATMYRTAMLRDIGLFDEDLYIYYEDVDLSFRAQLAGYDCLYVPAAVAYHHHAASSVRFGKRYYYLARNDLLVTVKNMQAPLVQSNLRAIASRQLSLALYMGTREHFRTYARACRDTPRLLPRMLYKRRAIMRNAPRSPEEIAARLT
jgi:GT2 family glycosyltransferase